MSRLSSFDQDLAGTAQDLTVSGFAYNPASQIGALTRSNDTYAWGGHYNANRNYAVNGLNQMTAAGATSLGFDGRGNLTSSGSSTYQYTSDNVMATTGSGVYLANDPLGRIVQVYANGGALVTPMDYVGSKLISEMNGSNQLIRRYVYGPGDDEPLTWYEGSGTTDRRWLHADERGSVIAVTNASGSAIAINSYDEYGIPASANIGRFQYTGQAWLPELGMYYYKARMYSPTLGRFMQTDPIGYKDGVNWYAYVGNDPVNHTDPTGKECNKERTSCTADNALNSRAKDVRHNTQTDSAVIAARRQFQSATKKGGEPTGTVTGTTVTSTASKAGSTSTGDTAAFSLGKADAGVHGHLGGSVTDDPPSNGGYGDTQSLTRGKPLYTVEGNRVGVHDSPGGVMRFEMVQGKMTPSEAKDIQRNLNEAQERFNRIGPLE